MLGKPVEERYEEAVNYLYQRLPMYQRVGSMAYKKDLGNISVLCEALGNPHHNFKSIHIAGTNGKGSTSHLISACLQSAGYTVGLYTSPHLKRFTERIKINGEEAEQSFVVDFIEKSKAVIEQVNPSFFEVSVAMAFFYFAERKVDIAVVEVGLGGRLDSTNIINPEVSVITNIGMDHQVLLGNTLAAIAGEKAGIIKEGVPVVVGRKQLETTVVFEKIAQDKNAKLHFVESMASIEESKGETCVTVSGKLKRLCFKPSLKGGYQKENILTAVVALMLLKQKGYDKITPDSLQYGLENTTRLTNLKGRWQQLQAVPKTFCDVGHNADGIQAIVQELNATPHKKLHLVLGMVADKDVQKMLSLWPKGARFYLCAPTVPRALPVEELAGHAKKLGLEFTVHGSVSDAMEKAIAVADDNDVVFIGGSTFVVAEIEAL